MDEQDKARALAKEVFRLLAVKGGSRNTEAQNQARKENLKRARWKKKHPGEQYQEDHR